jgi:hypothetical protein
VRAESFELALTAREDFDFGASGLADIAQCLRVIATTRAGTVPLDRSFGTSWDWIDRPEPVAMAKYRAELFDAIRKWEPRVEVLGISFRRDGSAAMTGRLIPVVRLRLAEGVDV